MGKNPKTKNKKKQKKPKKNKKKPKPKKKTPNTKNQEIGWKIGSDKEEGRAETRTTETDRLLRSRGLRWWTLNLDLAVETAEGQSEGFGLEFAGLWSRTPLWKTRKC